MWKCLRKANFKQLCISFKYINRLVWLVQLLLNILYWFHTLQTKLSLILGDKRHKCTQCDKAFVKSADLKRHIAAHNNEKNFKCTECDSAFTRKDNLKAHMLLHSRDAVVTCDKCNKEFINRVYLKRHMHVHNQAKKKPYE